MNYLNTGVHCQCGGMVQAELSSSYLPMASPGHYGPESNNVPGSWHKTIEGYHCNRCGLKYTDVGQFDDFLAGL